MTADLSSASASGTAVMVEPYTTLWPVGHSPVSAEWMMSQTAGVLGGSAVAEMLPDGKNTMAPVGGGVPSWTGGKRAERVEDTTVMEWQLVCSSGVAEDAVACDMSPREPTTLFVLTFSPPDNDTSKIRDSSEDGADFCVEAIPLPST